MSNFIFIQNKYRYHFLSACFAVAEWIVTKNTEYFESKLDENSRMKGHEKGGCCLKAAEPLGSLSCDSLQLLKPRQVGLSADPYVTQSKIPFTAGSF